MTILPTFRAIEGEPTDGVPAGDVQPSEIPSSIVDTGAPAFGASGQYSWGLDRIGMGHATGGTHGDGRVRFDGEDRTGGLIYSGESGTPSIDGHFGGGVFVAAGDIEAHGPFLFHAGYLL